MKYLIKIVFLFALLHFCLSCRGQDKSLFNKNMITANLGVGYYQSGANLGDRYGANTGMSVALEKIFPKGSSVSLEYQLNFGNNVNEDVFSAYRNDNGVIIGINGLGSFTYLRMRANYLGLNFGQHLYKKNKGLKLQIGGGLFSHYIRILDDSRNLVLADDPYRKGFDRLTNGLAAKQEVVYEYHGQTNNYHFNIGFSILEGFTNPVRSINFDTGLPSKRDRIDILYGLKVTWMMPLYKASDAVKYF